MFLPDNMLLSSVSQKFIAEEVDDLEAKNAGDQFGEAMCWFVPLCAALCSFVPLCATADTDTDSSRSHVGILPTKVRFRNCYHHPLGSVYPQSDMDGWRRGVACESESVERRGGRQCWRRTAGALTKLIGVYPVVLFAAPTRTHSKDKIVVALNLVTMVWIER